MDDLRGDPERRHPAPQLKDAALAPDAPDVSGSAGPGPLPGRLALAAVGTLSLGLGLLGAFLPLLPTTPFVLLAAGCYARAWPPAHAWMRRNRFLGPICRSGEEGRYLPRRAKAVALVVTGLSFGATIAFAVSSWVLRGVLVVLAALVVAFLVRLPTAPPARTGPEEGGPPPAAPR